MDFLREALTSNNKTALVDLDISQNNLGYAGIHHLGLFLSNENCKIKNLAMINCGVQGKTSLTLFLGLKKCYTLESIKLAKSNFSLRQV